MRPYAQGALEALLWVRELLRSSTEVGQALREVEEALQELQEGLVQDFRQRLRATV